MKRTYRTKFNTYRLTDIDDECMGRDDLLLTFEKKPTWLGKLFLEKERTFQVAGGYTVWYHYPSGNRIGLHIFNFFDERRFLAIWKAHHWKKQRQTPRCCRCHKKHRGFC